LGILPTASNTLLYHKILYNDRFVKGPRLQVGGGLTVCP